MDWSSSRSNLMARSEWTIVAKDFAVYATTLNDLFASWAQAPSATEAEKNQHGFTCIKKAIDGSRASADTKADQSPVVVLSGRLCQRPFPLPLE